MTHNLDTRTTRCFGMGENSKILHSEINDESSSLSLFSESLTGWLMILRMCKKGNEKLSNHKRGWPGRQVGKGLEACYFRFPSINVLRMDGRIETSHLTWGEYYLNPH
jgi:hypothetical protein